LIDQTHKMERILDVMDLLTLNFGTGKSHCSSDHSWFLRCRGSFGVTGGC